MAPGHPPAPPGAHSGSGPRHWWQWLIAAQRREAKRILTEMLQMRGLMPLLMKPRNGASWTPEERRHVPGLQPKRSEIILAGLIIAKSFLKRYEIPAVMASERDIMEGIFFRHSFHDAAWNSKEGRL